MTLVISTAQASAIATAGNTDRPLILWDNSYVQGCTISQSLGTVQTSVQFLKTPSTWDFWSSLPNGSGDADFQMDMGSAVDVDCVAIASHNAFDVATSVVVQWSTSGAGPWTTIGASPTLSNNSSIGWHFVSQSARYWRLLFSGVGLADIVRVGTVYVGGCIQIPRKVLRGVAPAITPTNVELESNVTMGGHLVSTAEIRKSSSMQLAFNLIPSTYVRATAWINFQNHFNSGEPIFIAWRPSGYPQDFHYAWRDGGVIRST